MLAWKRGSLRKALWPLRGVAALSFALAALAWAIQTGNSALGPVGVLLGTWVVAGSLVDLWLRTGREGFSVRLRRLMRLPRADWGKATSHIGMGVTILGISMLLAWEVEDIRVAQIGERFPVGNYEVELRSVDQVEGPNYRSTMATMGVYRNGREIAVLTPEKRFYPVAGMPTTEAAIDLGFTRDIYLVIGDPQANGGWAVRSHVKPFANWIWGGAILMAIGGFISLSDRRLRVAAGASREVRSGGGAGGQVPAE